MSAAVASGVPLRARIVFRDRTVADVLDLALRFVAVHGRSYAKVALALLAPAALASIAAGLALGWPAAWAVAVPLAVLAETAFTVLASRLVFEEDVRARDVLAAALRDLPRVAALRGLAAGVIALGFVALLIPGFWCLAIFAMQAEVMLLERATLVASMGRAQRLAQHAFSEVLIASFLFAILPVAAALASDVAGRVVLGELLQVRPPPATWRTGGSALAALGLFAQVPYVATARFFLYLNVRTRVEGWDIQTRFAELSRRDADATTTTSPNEETGV